MVKPVQKFDLVCRVYKEPFAIRYGLFKHDEDIWVNVENFVREGDIKDILDSMDVVEEYALVNVQVDALSFVNIMNDLAHYYARAYARMKKMLIDTVEPKEESNK